MGPSWQSTGHLACGAAAPERATAGLSHAGSARPSQPSARPPVARGSLPGLGAITHTVAGRSEAGTNVGSRRAPRVALDDRAVDSPARLDRPVERRQLGRVGAPAGSAPRPPPRSAPRGSGPDRARRPSPSPAAGSAGRPSRHRQGASPCVVRVRSRPACRRLRRRSRSSLRRPSSRAPPSIPALVVSTDPAGPVRGGHDDLTLGGHAGTAQLDLRWHHRRPGPPADSRCRG